ncbi:PREDICTED: uncharacterized protein LOC109133037 [Camelina sativa]|uniref:Uncharacterized protein LOC109133037 n=1 Tax=Camelina sativa TaxID=90675 RepID=A0ABM1RQ25_CAMSA|nr:PREDICTED: uncharacterized protein LOC109133037 [Camelina sativa]
MKLVVFFSLVLMFSLCSSGFKTDNGVTVTSSSIYQHSSDKVEESSESLMDYPKTGPNTPGGSRFRPPHPMMKKKISS